MLILAEVITVQRSAPRCLILLYLSRLAHFSAAVSEVDDAISTLFPDFKAGNHPLIWTVLDSVPFSIHVTIRRCPIWAASAQHICVDYPATTLFTSLHSSEAIVIQIVARLLTVWVPASVIGKDDGRSVAAVHVQFNKTMSTLFPKLQPLH